MRSRLIRAIRRVAIWTSVILLVVVLAGFAYYKHEIDVAKRKTPNLVAATLDDVKQRRAFIHLEEVTPRQLELILAVEDPSFRIHHGVDFSTPGAGWTTITQGLSKLLYFPEGFEPGFKKIQQTLLAEYALDATVSKDDQLELYLNITYLGSKDGRTIAGYEDAARSYFGKSFGALTEREFISLLGMTVSPNKLKPGTPANEERISRIQTFLNGDYTPVDLMDVTYDGKGQNNGASGKSLLLFLKALTRDSPDE
ncbi:transglycosylase domain-containing protein [Luteolibacter pohnpeiensis]|uniref:Transglycosylase domain-containing protein n=1 Tax=Luteolibacter pohnpeiensis TaxID=454153 RepID=A0A934VY41_9BACT|nr:biosynthetic peptidoglycan transglycosylase [Luteolibacter pohnpeiensis]MBK1884498.1 transglycosylase domain-containing protein [Luteolibacter pohnpeiensis]